MLRSHRLVRVTCQGLFWYFRRHRWTVPGCRTVYTNVVAKANRNLHRSCTRLSDVSEILNLNCCAKPEVRSGKVVGSRGGVPTLRVKPGVSIVEVA